jgi:hypothetical protein
MNRQLQWVAVILVVMLSVACGDDASDSLAGPGTTTGSGTGTEPAITNATDDFQYQLNTSNFSTNGGYTWRNTGTSARVTNSSSISSGSGTLQIRDSGGRIVYAKSLTEAGTTEVGPAGDWRIDVTPSNVTGTINFRIQKN